MVADLLGAKNDSVAVVRAVLPQFLDTASLSAKAVAEATSGVPERSSCSIPSWMTSVYALSGRKEPWSIEV
jgi:hypothetical protein